MYRYLNLYGVHEDRKVTTNNLTARASIRIAKPPAEVFAAFVDAEAMSQFWFTRRDRGLKEGKSITWFLGDDADAFSFDILVKKIRAPECIEIEWIGPDGNATTVAWSIRGGDNGDTILTIEESGFAGTPEAIVERVLDSTGGFNQVVVAAKAFIEHGIGLNVVASHA
jgi:uncharacterized protein YndB with AHSA1/START domain